MNSIEVISEPRAEVGEGPHWDDDTGELLWVDLLRGDFYRHSLSSGAEQVIRLPQETGAVIPAQGGGYVAAVRDGIAAFTTTDDFKIVATIERDIGSNRMNDAKVDAAGRLWAGTMADDAAPNAGGLYRIDPDFTVTTMLHGVTQSNGLGWSPDQTRFYFIDTQTYRVGVYDYDHDAGTIGSPQTFADMSGVDDHYPDGLTVDAEGGVWVAVFGGGHIQRFAPDGSKDLSIALPSSQITSCTFGGPLNDTLFVTTACYGYTDADLAREPLAGSVFAVHTGHRGTPSHSFAAAQSGKTKQP